MTNDCHVFFNSQDELNHGYLALSNASINNEKIFYVEKDLKFKNKLFFQMNFKKRVSFNEYFSINNRLLKFSDYFILIRERTGEHIKEGDIFSDSIFFPGELKNHEISEHLLKHFEINN